KDGRTCANSPDLTFVIAGQPLGPTRRIPVTDDTRITPSLFHAPPPPMPMLSHSVSTPPPAMSTRLSFASSANAIQRLSYDQNGKKALSVPARGCAVSESSGRTHN